MATGWIWRACALAAAVTCAACSSGGVQIGFDKNVPLGVASTVGGASNITGPGLLSQLAPQLDDAERQKALAAQTDAISSGSPRRWSGRPGYYGYVEPGAASQTATGTCRDYSHSISIDGRLQRGNGQACRQPNGTWEIVS